jgi:thiopurine S-methyltransferase
MLPSHASVNTHYCGLIAGSSNQEASTMSKQLWIEKWERNDISFHQHSINPLLQQYLPSLNLSAGDCLLVPLCGKTVDLNWLSKSGFRVFGIEISEIAIQAFFDALQVKPQRLQHGRFIRWSYQNIEIWCGDIFDLSILDMSNVKALYDNASLTAFSASERPAYIRHFFDNLPHDCQILLITDETPDDQQFNSVMTIDSEVSALYSENYQIEILHGKNCIKKDPSNPEAPEQPMEEKVYLIKRNNFSGRF